MNRALDEMHMSEDLTVLERQHARLKWQQQQQQSYFPEAHHHTLPHLSTQNLHPFPIETPQGLSIIEELAKNEWPSLRSGWPEYNKFQMPATQTGFLSAGSAAAAVAVANLRGLDSTISRTLSCPLRGNVTAVDASARNEKGGGLALPEKASLVRKESFKKRKADKASCLKDNGLAEETSEKKIKGGDAKEGESKANATATTTTTTTATNNSSSNRETSADTSKENSKVSEVQKPDYIHVRARRGQATDSHSLAERVRREKISERMKFLQDLVPGCNKITGKAGMLDEIINYVQSLQRQVEFLSMKLAAVNPRLDFNIDSFFTKEMFSGCNGSLSTVAVSPELTNPALLQFNPIHQGTSCGLDMAINPSEMALRRSTSMPVSLPDTSDAYLHAHGSSSNTWEIDLLSLYNADFQQGKLSIFPSQTFTDNLEVNNLKMEM